MTTQPGEGGKQAASLHNTIHLTSDHDNIGEPRNWCGAESFQTSESLADVTCLLCLKAAQIYGEGAATRLQHLENTECHEQYAADKTNPDGSNKSFYDSGIRGMDGETAIRLFQEGAKR